MTNYSSKCRRYDSLVSDVKSNIGKFDVEVMKKALYNARIPGINVQAVIFEPASKTAYISINKEPAAGGPYRKFDIMALINHNE